MTSDEQADAKAPLWFEQHPLLRKLVFWAIVSGALFGFYLAFLRMNEGKWIATAALALPIAAGALRMVRAQTKRSDDGNETS